MASDLRGGDEAYLNFSAFKNEFIIAIDKQIPNPEYERMNRSGVDFEGYEILTPRTTSEYSYLLMQLNGKLENYDVKLTKMGTQFISIKYLMS